MGNRQSSPQSGNDVTPYCRSCSRYQLKSSRTSSTLAQVSTGLKHVPKSTGKITFLTKQVSSTFNFYPNPNVAKAYRTFLKNFPEYRLTRRLDHLRRKDFLRVDNIDETYVDYMGGSLYPDSLVKVHARFLSRNVFGNTHSLNNSSSLSSHHADRAREAILSFFNAPPGYTVVFTPNASGALKLVGESYQFAEGSSYVLSADSHNSVHGIREYALRNSAQVHYIPTTNTGGFLLSTAEMMLSQNKPRSKDSPCLFGLTGQSNITNTKNPLSIVAYASSLGYDTLLDAAALVPTSRFSLSDTPVDAMAVSFYKMFGYPTGIGALVVKESFLEKLRRPWFAGGTIDVVQVPGVIVTKALKLHEQFEDGTINYLMLPAIIEGLRLLATYLPILPLRLSCLLHFLTASLSLLHYESPRQPVVRILSKLPSRRLLSVGDESDTGAIISMIFLFPSGDIIPNSFIEYAAASHKISLRTGCMCNPGGAAAMLEIEDDMSRLYPGVSMHDFENAMGRELGVVRISLGLASSFQDVWKVEQFARTIANDVSRQRLWDMWSLARSSIGGSPKRKCP